MRTCEFCGSEIPANASFCGICGRESRSVPQSIRGNGNPIVPGQNISGAGSNANIVNSTVRTNRKPYRFTPQSNDYQADVPTVSYSPRASAVAPRQQLPYPNPQATVNQSAQGYPSAQPQQPIYVGNPQPPKKGQ